MDSTLVRVPPLEAHRIWSRTYDSDLNPLLALEFRILSQRLGKLRGQLFLDVGCGTGRWLAEAQAQGATVVGVDLCREMLVAASTKPDLPGKLILADARQLPLPDRCGDVVMCAFSLGYVACLDTVVRELARAAKPGGSVLISDVHPKGVCRGWTRSFRSGARVYEIESHPYTTKQLIEAGQRAGLELQELLEPRFGEPERGIFRRGKKEAWFDQARELPAVLILHWKRAG